MSEITFYLVYVAIGISFLLPALWMLCHWSGENLSATQFWFALSYNVIFIYLHWNFLETSTLPFVGNRNIGIIGWYSLASGLIHGLALPRGKEIKFLCRRKKNSF